ncbi:calcyclin-binding protein [Prorops nasuta]|uniref:calcyclin-binding protein n=1 Tax=Prorops nasuta TaxID=863751 RepID=UPI0034CEAAFD
MATKTEELKLDIQELTILLQSAVRQKTKDLLSLEIKKLQTEFSELIDASKMDIDKQVITSTVKTTPKIYEVQLTNYGWDETNTTVKLYVTLNNVHQLQKESINCNFTEKSVNLYILNLDCKNYKFQINNLCEEINPEKSHFKVKTDMIVIFLVKKAAKLWSHITVVEKRIKESKTPSTSDMLEDSDPGASLMNLMKKMYQDGDDEIKKTIAKAWTESQQKNSAGLPDFPSV